MTMKLYYSAASPFASKVRATAMECGLADRISLVPTNPHDSDPGLVALNPYSKVPTLLLDDGTALYESLLVCEYLDTLAGGGIVIPRSGPERLGVMRKHALGNGLMEASVARRVESLRAREPDREKNIARQITVSRRGLDCLEAAAGGLGQQPDLGNLCIASALGYLDFRFAGDRWRDGRRRLADWFAVYSQRPSVAVTLPGDAAAPVPAAAV
jgi:glutathione S-transferase